MTALELISLVNQALFIGLFVVVLRHALRQRTRPTFDTALLFGSVAAALVVSRLTEISGSSDASLVLPLLLLLLNLAPYAMLRLVADFSGTPRWIQVAGAVAYVGIAALGFAITTQPQLVELAIITWFLAVGGYAAVAFAREAVRTRGITRRRMTAVATGAVLFIGAIVVVFADAVVAGESPLLGIVAQVAALAAVVSFFLGFAPPSWIRRAWREPDLRGFLERSIRLVGVSDDRTVITELQQSAAAAFGASGASIGVSDGKRPVLRYVDRDGEWVEHPDDAFIAGRAFQERRRVVARDAAAADPDNADTYERNMARTVIAAPVTTEDRRIGALAIYAERGPIFVEDDLWLIELLADQTAVLLEARDLARHASQLQAREDAARLKEEFLSAAAHDLRTPLTVVLGQAELLERRLARDPTAPADAAGVARMASEARRLRDLISEMLDAQRLEQPGTVMDRLTLDLRGVVEAVRGRQLEHGRVLQVSEPAAPILTAIDRMRIEQVLDNLIENALKYSAGGELPQIRIWEEGAEARFAVADRGVGIPPAERVRIFDRFYRASNAQSITDTGMGLGLYICRRIVEEHGGRIWVEPTAGGGSTFIVALPLMSAATDDTEVPATEPSWGMQPGAEAAADA
ncbi:MAG TPA: ATP-binding protein [Candidatus Limnocylindrales bacterium]|nr:ATP-binding protein [Candidatus Limnocylindrales bacterium]